MDKITWFVGCDKVYIELYFSEHLLHKLRECIYKISGGARKAGGQEKKFSLKLCLHITNKYYGKILHY
jgi:predicted nucleic acid-binding protein